MPLALVDGIDPIQQLSRFADHLKHPAPTERRAPPEPLALGEDVDGACERMGCHRYNSRHWGLKGLPTYSFAWPMAASVLASNASRSLRCRSQVTFAVDLVQDFHLCPQAFSIEPRRLFEQAPGLPGLHHLKYGREVPGCQTSMCATCVRPHAPGWKNLS